MEWEAGLSGRAKMKITKYKDVVYFEAVSKDNRDIRSELIKLVDTNDKVTFQTLFDYFDFGTMVGRDELVGMLKELTK